MTDAPGLAPFAAIAGSPAILLVLAAWGFAEAIVAPVVPDVLLGILLLAAPWPIVPLLSAAILGGVVGALADWWLLAHRPAFVHRLLAIQPGLGRPGLAEAETRLRQRGIAPGFAQIGPGLPLKAYLGALARVAPETRSLDVAGLALVNRVARLGPVALAFAALHPVAVASGWSAAVIGLVYVVGWTLFYAAYWIRRDPRGAR